MSVFFFSFYDFCNVVEQSANIGHLIFVFVNEFIYLVRVQIQFDCLIFFTVATIGLIICLSENLSCLMLCFWSINLMVYFFSTRSWR